MKKFFIALIMIVVYVLMIAYMVRADGHNYEGHLAPETFMTWQRVAQAVSPNGQVLIRFINPGGQIEKVDAIFFIDKNDTRRMLLIAYTYTFAGQPYIIKNDGKGFYKQVYPKLDNV